MASRDREQDGEIERLQEGLARVLDLQFGSGGGGITNPITVDLVPSGSRDFGEVGNRFDTVYMQNADALAVTTSAINNSGNLVNGGTIFASSTVTSPAIEVATVNPSGLPVTVQGDLNAVSTVTAPSVVTPQLTHPSGMVDVADDLTVQGNTSMVGSLNVGGLLSGGTVAIASLNVGGTSNFIGNVNGVNIFGAVGGFTQVSSTQFNNSGAQADFGGSITAVGDIQAIANVVPEASAIGTAEVGTAAAPFGAMSAGSFNVVSDMSKKTEIDASVPSLPFDIQPFCYKLKYERTDKDGDKFFVVNSRPCIGFDAAKLKEVSIAISDGNTVSVVALLSSMWKTVTELEQRVKVLEA